MHRFRLKKKEEKNKKNDVKERKKI